MTKAGKVERETEREETQKAQPNRRQTYVFQVSQQIRHSFTFIIGQSSLVNAIPRATTDRPQALGDMTPR